MRAERRLLLPPRPGDVILPEGLHEMEELTKPGRRGRGNDTLPLVPACDFYTPNGTYTTTEGSIARVTHAGYVCDTSIGQVQYMYASSKGPRPFFPSAGQQVPVPPELMAHGVA